ncbi:hypothetical protein RB594_008039 [Gaeumannomyces avenae]
MCTVLDSLALARYKNLSDEDIRRSWDLSFVVQPVSYTGVGQQIPPVAVRILPPNQHGEAVYAHCSLVTLDDQPVEPALIPGTSNYQEALESDRGTHGLMCHASEPTHSDPIIVDPARESPPKKRSAGGGSSSRAGGSSSSSSKGNWAAWTSPGGIAFCADGGDLHLYFAFSGLKVAWPGTYALHVEIYRCLEYTEPVARVISGPIQVMEGNVPNQKLSKTAQRVLLRLQEHHNMANLQINSNDFADFI